MLYGRFDFAYDGRNIKMLEYNADTPTGLLEASVAQWLRIEQVSGIANRDQFNSIVKLLYYSYKIRKKLEITHRLSRSTILYAYV